MKHAYNTHLQEKEKPTSSVPLSGGAVVSLSSGARLRKLFFETLYLSAFTFGGGYVIVSLLKKKFVDDLHWISEEEMLDLVAIAQSAPGPIAVNGAIVVGYKICGFPGILVSVLGAVLPPFAMLSVISLFYNVFRSNFMIHHLLSGMRCGVSAVIMSVTWDMASGVLLEKPKHARPMQASRGSSSSAQGVSTAATSVSSSSDQATPPTPSMHWSSLVIMVGAFIANYILGISTIWIILSVIVLGVALTLWRTRQEKACASTASAFMEEDSHASTAPDTDSSSAPPSPLHSGRDKKEVEP